MLAFSKTSWRKMVCMFSRCCSQMIALSPHGMRAQKKAWFWRGLIRGLWRTQTENHRSKTLLCVPGRPTGPSWARAAAPPAAGAASTRGNSSSAASTPLLRRRLAGMMRQGGWGGGGKGRRQRAKSYDDCFCCYCCSCYGDCEPHRRYFHLLSPRRSTVLFSLTPMSLRPRIQSNIVHP